jgi:hypothetical protein
MPEEIQWTATASTSSRRQSVAAPPGALLLRREPSSRGFPGCGGASHGRRRPGPATAKGSATGRSSARTTAGKLHAAAVMGVSVCRPRAITCGARPASMNRMTAEGRTSAAALTPVRGGSFVRRSSAAADALPGRSACGRALRDGNLRNVQSNTCVTCALADAAIMGIRLESVLFD